MTSTTATAGSDADRQAVLEPLAGVYRAWEAGDAEAFVADYTEDASVIQPGVYEKDREEIRTTMAAGFAGPLSGSRVADCPVDVRFLTGDTAIVVSEGGIIFPGQDAWRASGWCARPGCWSGATAAGASPPTTTVPPAKAPSSRVWGVPFRGAGPVPGSTRVPGLWQRLAQS